MPKILLVEDHEEIWDSLSRRLRRRGFDVILAFDGEQGVERASSETPDLILMDMNLPLLDGRSAVRRLRSAPGTATIPIIALTAHALAGDRDKALRAGCDDYHSKPVELSRLLEQIAALLESGTGRPTLASDPVAQNEPQKSR